MPSFSLLPQQGRHSLHLSPPSGDVDVVPRIAPLADVHVDPHYVHPKTGLDNQIVTPDRVIIHDEMKMERKRKVHIFFLNLLQLVKPMWGSCYGLFNIWW